MVEKNQSLLLKKKPNLIRLPSLNFELEPFPTFISSSRKPDDLQVSKSFSSQHFSKSIEKQLQNGQYFNKPCASCKKDLNCRYVVLLNCDHILHQPCWEKMSKSYHNCCTICLKLAQSKVIDCYFSKFQKCAILIQKTFRGFLARRVMKQKHLFHKQAHFQKDQYGSEILSHILKIQNEKIDAVLLCVEKELEWARDIMKYAEEYEKTVNWDLVISKIDLNQSCPICLCSIDKDNLSVISCGHVIHTDCLVQFLDFSSKQTNQTRCPMCRSIFKFKIISRI